MDFNDSPEEAAFRKEAYDWLSANAELKPADHVNPPIFSKEAEESHGDDPKVAQAWQAKKAKANWACITWPKEYGGRGGTPMQNAIWGQEEAKFQVPPNIFGIALMMAGPTLMVHGTPEQKERYIPKMITGEEIWCQLFSEPGAGSDLAAVRTRAEKDGDEWVINGQKVWTSGAHYADYGILIARTDPNVAKHKGLTFFIMDMKQPGIEIRPIKQIGGSANFNEVFFDNVRIPDENRVDAVGNGWMVTLTVLMNERMGIGAGAIGSAVKPNDLLHAAQNSYVNGVPALQDTSVRQQLADYIARLKALEFSGYRTMTTLSQGKIPGPEGSLGKLWMGKLIQETSAYAMELQGAMSGIYDVENSYKKGYWQSSYMAIAAMRIGGGADEIQRNIIGERLLGLPQEPRLDKDLAYSEIPTGPEK